MSLIPPVGTDRYVAWRYRASRERRAARVAERLRIEEREREAERLRLYNFGIERLRTKARAIVIAVAETAGLAPSDIMGQSRRKPCAQARQDAMLRCHIELGWGISELGRQFGRDHTTALNAIRKARARVGLREAGL